jgi:putative ABC transport system substrate-binding protein
MRRREFIGVLGGATAWPFTAHAQPTKLATIGMLIPANPEPYMGIFQRALRDLGYEEGRNVHFVSRSAGGKPQLLAGFAAEFVRLKVDVIVAFQTPAVTAAKQATKDIPIVMAGAGDPVATGLVASLARPGGNITGMSGTTAEAGAKILEILRDILPSLRRVAVLANTTDPFTKTFLEQIHHGGQVLGIAVQPLTVRGVEDFDAAFAAMVEAKADAVVVQPSLPQKAAADLALKHRLPPISPTRFFPSVGGLMSYSNDITDLYRHAAEYVVRILKGDKPADLPVQEPTKYDLIINLKTAKALGLKVPATLLARADDVIE